MGDKKTMKIYMGLCGAIALIYGLWMAAFMRWDQYPYIIPTDADMLLTSAGLDLVMTARCLSHWATALIFAFLGAAGVIIFLVHKCRQKEKNT